MKVWRGILELNCSVIAETEEEAQEKLAAIPEAHDWIVWIEKEDP